MKLPRTRAQARHNLHEGGEVVDICFTLKARVSSDDLAAARQVTHRRAAAANVTAVCRRPPEA